MSRWHYRCMEVDALVFDLGGVLLEVDFRRGLGHWAAAARMPVESLAARWRRDEAYCAHERGELADREYFAHLRSLLGLRIGEAEMLAGWNAVLGEPLPGVERLVGRLARDFPLYVFSNTNPAHVAHFTPRYRPLLGHFTRTVTSCELGERKPEPEAFRRLARLIGAAPGRLAFFDDLEENVAGARRAGLHAFRASSAAEIEAISGTLRPARTAR
ncbi:MAG TPA: HAD family phosphatase [Burkholderiales bacterium]|nr:HAD family phosphatase [Burkholderiales bacterium]